MKSSRAALVLLLLLVPLSRAVPALSSGAVFSTDSWPLIRLAQLLATDPCTKLLDLDTHHAKWPLAVLFSLVYTGVTRVDVYTFYALLGPPLLALALALLLYALLGRLTSGLPRALALLALLVYPSFAIFTSAYLKEVYAYPVAAAFLLAVAKGRVKWPGVFVAALALVLAHPLASLMVLASMATYIFIKLVEKVKLATAISLKQYKGVFVATLLLASLYLAHVLHVGLPYTLSAPDVAALAAYTTSLYLTYLVLYADVWGFSAATAVALLVSAAAYASAVEGVAIDLGVLPYGLPLLTLIFAFYKPEVDQADAAASLLLPLGVGVLYALTYARWLADVVHRLLNYLVFPLALGLAAAAKAKPRAALILALLLAANGCIALHRASTGDDPILFYWRYTAADLALKSFLEGHAVKPVPASVKYSYMLGEESSGGLLALRAFLTCSPAGRGFLAVGRGDLVHGVPLSPTHRLKPERDVFECSGVVFNSAENYLLVR